MKNLLIFLSILFFTFQAHAQDFRDNFVGDYVCTCYLTDYWGGPPVIVTRNIEVLKHTTDTNLIKTIYAGYTYYHTLCADSTFEDTWEPWKRYGHFMSSDSIYFYRRTYGAYFWWKDECWGEKITTAIPANAPAIRSVATPNPADDFIHISLPLPGENRYQLINAQGKAVLNGNFTRNTRLDVSMLAPGFYVLRVAGNNWQSEEKIIIR